MRLVGDTMHRIVRVAIAFVAPIAIAVPALIAVHDLSPPTVVLTDFGMLMIGLAVGEVIFVPATTGSVGWRCLYAAAYAVLMIGALAFAALWVEGAVFGNTL
jgi:hypothetical protein